MRANNTCADDGASKPIARTQKRAIASTQAIACARPEVSTMTSSGHRSPDAYGVAFDKRSSAIEWITATGSDSKNVNDRRFESKKLRGLAAPFSARFGSICSLAVHL